MSTISTDPSNFVSYNVYGSYDFTGSGTVSLDVSNKTGEYYVAMSGYSDGVFDMDVTKIWLE